MFSTSQSMKKIQVGLNSRSQNIKEWSSSYQLGNSNEDVITVKVDSDIFSSNSTKTINMNKDLYSFY